MTSSTFDALSKMNYFQKMIVKIWKSPWTPCHFSKLNYARMQIVLYPQLHHTKGYMPEHDS